MGEIEIYMKEKLKKEHFEILLEEMKGDIKLVLEGHSVLDKKISDVKEMIKAVDTKVEDTRMVVKEINRELKAHVRMPAYV